MPTELEKDVEDGTYFAAYVSKEVLFTISDWLGTKWAKQHSTKIIVLIVGEYKDVHDQFKVKLKQSDFSRSETISKKLVEAIEFFSMEA